VNGCYYKAVGYFVQDVERGAANKPQARRAWVGVNEDHCR